MDSEYLSASTSKEEGKEPANILQSKEYLSANGELIVPIGKREDGSVLVQDLFNIPHILICGTTGSGKTSFVQTLITCLITRYPADKVGFLIFDSKIVDYAGFNALPHLASPIITDDQKMKGAISWAEVESKKRLQLFASNKARDLKTYNSLCNTNGGAPLQSLFIIIDDYAMLNADNQMIQSITSILRYGRASGIHMIFVTSVLADKTLQKEYLPNVQCRIVFRVTAKGDSQIVLERTGAEQLYVPGEIFFKGQGTFTKCQSAFIPYEIIQKSVSRVSVKERKKLSALSNAAERIFTDINNQGKETTEVQSTAKKCPTYDYDDLLFEAVNCIFRTQQASVSMLQRELMIGYSRAARLIDQLEEVGVVGPYEGSKPRAVLMTEVEWIAKKYEIMPLKGAALPLENQVQKPTVRPSPEKERRSETIEDLKPDDSHVQIDVSGQRSNKHNQNLLSPNQDGEKPDIPMRDFATFQVGERSLGVSDNRIILTKRIMTRFGPGTAKPSFNGKIVKAIIYKKPRLFSRGYIQFVVSKDSDIINERPHLMTVTKDTLPEFLKIEFGQSEARMMDLFVTQIASDIGITVSRE